MTHVLPEVSPAAPSSSFTDAMASAETAIRVGRPVLGSTCTASDPVSDRLDLTRALTPTEVAEVLAVLPTRATDKPWHWWGPRLALAMALSAKHIALLDTRQLRFRAERVWIDFPPPGRPANANARPRTVPVHSALLTAGFAQFAHGRYFSEGREGPLFPDLAEATRPGDAMASWLRRSTTRLRRAGHPAPTFADLRATCAQAALDGGASVAAVEALMGVPLDGWDDPGPFDAHRTARCEEERLLEAIDAVRLPGLDAWEESGTPSLSSSMTSSGGAPAGVAAHDQR